MSFSQDSKLTIKALEMAWETRGKPQGVMFHSSGKPLYKQAVPTVTVALPDQEKYESPWKLLG